MAYGETEDAERLLQILNSHRIRNRIIEKFDLFTHYNIDPSEPGAQADMALTYGSNVSANSDKVRVHQSVCARHRPVPGPGHGQRHGPLGGQHRQPNEERPGTRCVQSGLEHIDQTTVQIAETEDSLATLHSLGIYDFEAQVEGLTAQYGMALASNNGAAARTISKDFEQLGALANGYNNLSAYLESAYEQKALLQKRVDLMRVDAETQLPSSFVVDYASAADKKAKPVRWLIVVMTAIVAVGAAFLGMLAWETLQRAQAPHA